MNMLIKESELIKNTNDILSQLNEAVYLTQEESQIHASEVPVVVKENGTNLVDYEYINSISEQNGIGLFEALSTISQSNGLDSLNISIDEGDAITIGEQFNPELMVVRPVSENSYEYTRAMAICESFYNEELNEESFYEMMMSFAEAEDYADLVDKHFDRERDVYNKKWDKLLDDRDKAFKNGKVKDVIDEYEPKFGELRANHRKAFDNRSNRLFDNSKTAENKLDSLRQIAKERKSEEDRAADDDERLLSRAANISKPDSNGNTVNNTANGTNNADIPDEKKSNVSATVSSPSTSSGNGGALIARPSNSLLGGGSSGSDKGKYLKYGAAAVGGAALAGGAWYAYKKYKNQPKSVIGKRIAALRQIYAKFMKRAQSAKDNGIAAKLKKVAAHVLKVIDKLLGYLQNKAG